MLKELFEMQKVLSEKINAEHPSTEGEDRTNLKILALQVELAECCNEDRFFKFWSYDREPKTKLFRIKDSFGKEEVLDFDPRMLQENFYPEVKEFNPLLEEYVDVLHFLLDVGLDLDAPKWMDSPIEWTTKNKEEQYSNIFKSISELRFAKDEKDRKVAYQDAFDLFYGLGSMLGFNWEEIQIAYITKNKINHSRVENKY